MNTPAEQLLQKMGEDKAFAETILKQSEIRKVIELAKDEGIALTQENIDEANAIIQKVVELQANSQGVLTEEELEQVAGGNVRLLIPFTILSVGGPGLSASGISQ